jgi:hypothetical protein
MMEIAKLITGKVFQNHEIYVIPLPCVYSRERCDASLLLLDHILETVVASFTR